MDKKKCFWLALVFFFWGCSGGEGETNDVAVVVYVDADGSFSADGSRENPYSLEQAIGFASEIIVLLDQAGPFVGRYELSSGQNLVGGGDLGIANYILPSGKSIDITGLGGRPVIVNVADPVLATSPITLSNDTMIAGIEIIGGSSGIFCHRSDNIVLENIRITGSGFHGLELLGCDNLNISDITITDVEIFSGIRIFDSMNIRINSVDVVTNGESLIDKTNVGIDISGSDYVEIDSFYMNDSDSAGIEVNGISEIHLSNIVIEASLFKGLDISASEIHLSDIYISNTGYEGSLIEGEMIYIDGMTLTNIGSDGFVFDQHYDANSMNITIDNTTINNADTGIYFFSADSVSISGGENSFTNVSDLCRVNGEINISDDLEISQGECIESP